MSSETLHDYAQGDTPQKVDVPNTWPGLLTWVVARFGVHAAMLAVIGYWGSMALDKVYSDMQSSNMRLLVLMENRAVADSKLADAMNQSTAARITWDAKLTETLNGLSKAMEEIRREAENAHRKQP